MKKVSEMSPQELAEASAKAMWDNDNATQHLGMTLESVGPGTAVLSMTITEAMTNGHGNCHGGYLFTLADSAFAFACNSYNEIVVGQHCTITYLIPGRLGDKMTATAREVSRRGRSGIYDISITNPKGETVVEFRGNSRMVKGTHLPV